jgi:hypothetical protein
MESGCNYYSHRWKFGNCTGARKPRESGTD